MTRSAIVVGGVAVAFVLLASGLWLYQAAEVPQTEPIEAESPKPPESAKVPEGMASVPDGSTRIGVEREALREVAANRPDGPRPMWGRAATPPFTAEVDPFFLDIHPVTVAQFRKFVEKTGYTTQAERFGNGGVLNIGMGQWRLVDGANWRRPRGPDAPPAKDDHPVTQVSWNDAQAYCEWAGKRLPTEVEWEHAARDAGNDRSYCPGGECGRDSRIQNANTWQGPYPTKNTEADGYRYTSPVGAFDTTALGLTDMSGNVWEWTDSWYRSYNRRSAPLTDREKQERVQRGGSFLCRECGGFRVFARSHSTPETSLFHVGIRCAKDVPSG